MVRQGSAKALCVGSIPTLASNLNRECGKDLGGSGVQMDTKTDTGFSTPLELNETGVNSPTTR